MSKNSTLETCNQSIFTTAKCIAKKKKNLLRNIQIVMHHIQLIQTSSSKLEDRFRKEKTKKKTWFDSLFPSFSTLQTFAF